nr:hypothetical protein [Asticcacaulis endophyticus]
MAERPARSQRCRILSNRALEATYLGADDVLFAWTPLQANPQSALAQAKAVPR